MEKKEFLNEESYQKGKKKIIAISLAIFIIGVLLGGGLIATGLIKSSNVKTESSERSKESIQEEIDSLNSELASLKAKMNEELLNNSLGEEYYRLQDEISSKTEKVQDLESEIWESESGFNSTSVSIEKAKYIPFYMFGGFIIVASSMIALFVYMIAKRREIAAFSAQQVMPVAQEGMQKMAPSFGNVAKEISKGITEGIQEGKNKKD